MKSAALIILSLAVLAGCANDEQKIAALERRVSAAEEKIKRIEAASMIVEEGPQQSRALVPSQTATTAASSATPVRVGPVEIVRSDFRAGESNASWTQYSYLIAVRNTTGAPVKVTGDVLWLDKDGFTIDTEPVRETVSAGESTLTGQSLINASQASRVASVRFTFD